MPESPVGLFLTVWLGLMVVSGSVLYAITHCGVPPRRERDPEKDQQPLDPRTEAKNQ